MKLENKTHKPIMTMKKIEDYLHLYFGCVCECGVTGDSVKEKRILNEISPGVMQMAEKGWVKPLLRPIADMTEEEQDFRWNNFINIKVINQEVVAEEIRWLLSKQFDLFNLIHEGLAIKKPK